MGIMAKRTERILVILNPSSGVISKDIATSIIFKKLRRHFDTVSLINTNSVEHAQEITRNAMDHFHIIVAFGGDGTVNSIAKLLLNSDTTLGILPGGSGNGLARNLHLPLNWRGALDTLINGHDITIDSGIINGTNFFNVAGIGLDAFISKQFNQQAKSRGMLPYFYYALKGYFEMPIYQIEITLEDMQYNEEIMLAAFANFQQYGLKAVIAPFASPFDHELDLCILKKFKFLHSTRSIPRLFTGSIHKFPFYKTNRFQQVHIRSLRGPIPFHFDGEYSGQDSDEYTVEVIPESIRVRVPRK